MGTRSGDVDPVVISFIARKEGLDVHEVESLLNEHSGLLGVSGLTHEYAGTARGSPPEQRSPSLTCYRNILLPREKVYGRLRGGDGWRRRHCLTGGIGENSPEIRSRVCARLGWIGLQPKLTT